MGSIGTGFWLYNTWDQRFGKLPLPDADSQWFKNHHNIGTVVTVCFGVFLLYSLIAGARVLVNGEWDDVWYSLHLFAWASMVVLVLVHIALGLKVGGVPLLMSAFETRVRPKDSPRQWKQRFTSWMHTISQRNRS